MKKLLAKDPAKRIPSKDIPFHPFFKDLDFDKVSKMEIEAPIVPVIVHFFYIKKKYSDSDYSNIDPVFLNEQITSPYIKFKPSHDDSLFKDF